MILELSQLVRTFPCLVESCCFALVSLIQSFNKHTCDDILGSGAFNSQKLKSITAKHLCK
jgi:hypothetical protein